MIAAAHAAESSTQLPPLKHRGNNKPEEDEILNLIQRNLLYEKASKIKKGDFAKKYVSVDRPAEGAEVTRFGNSKLVSDAKAEVR